MCVLWIALVPSRGGAAASMAKGGAIAPPPLRPSALHALGRGHSLIEAGDEDRGYAVFDSLLQVAAARNDTPLRIASLIAKGGHLAWKGESKAAEPLLLDATQLAEGTKNWRLYCRAAIWRVSSLLDQGRLEDLREFAKRALPISIRVGDSEAEGFLRKGDEGRMTAGIHTIAVEQVSGGRVSSGIYFCRALISAPQKSETRKTRVVVIR